MQSLEKILYTIRHNVGATGKKKVDESEVSIVVGLGKNVVCGRD
jgi:hypothetical protein